MVYDMTMKVFQRGEKNEESRPNRGYDSVLYKLFVEHEYMNSKEGEYNNLLILNSLKKIKQGICGNWRKMK